MDKELRDLSERILSLTLEIIYLLTGEGYTVVKKVLNNHVAPRNHLRVSGRRLGSQSPTLEPSPSFLILEKNNHKKILEVNNKITELLTGEVPIRCQDVAVYFSMEEWEYVERHKELYKDVMMASQPALTSPDPGNMEDTQRDLKDKEGEEEEEEEEIHVKIEEEEIPLEISADGQYKSYSADNSLILFQSGNTEDGCFFDCPPPVTHPIDFGGSGRFLCNDCGECFTRKAELISHQKSHAVEKLYSCSECSKSFSRKVALLKHARVHMGKKPHSCSECGKSFSHRSALLVHERVHTGVKPYSCSECGKCFSLRESLTSHKRTHTGEKPFSCTECEKRFSWRKLLTRHQRTHTGVKPYSCAECGKCFIDRSGLVTHQRTHTSDRPYACIECGRGFKSKSNLARHERVHTGDQPYICYKCGERFPWKSSLLAHLSSQCSQIDVFTSPSQTIIKQEIILSTP